MIELSKIIGVAEARQALRNAPKYIRFLAADVIEDVIKSTHLDAKANMNSMGIKKKSGNLSRFYRRSINKKKLTGRVGLLSSRARKKAFYARFINDGTEKMTARPFHTAAVEKNDAKFLSDSINVLRKVGLKL